MDAKFSITPARIARHSFVGGKDQAQRRDINKFITELGSRAPFDTGFLPPGVRSYAQAGDHAQVVIECAPGLHLVNWGARERDVNAKTYLLAQPYRLIIADLLAGNLLGARMFYSPTPIVHPEQPLYHANVPNLNCQGYRGNGVGWLCHYHRETWTNWDFKRKVERIIERCSGVETYNDANMSETDGPRFYQQQGKPQYLWDPKEWEKRSEEDGFEWTLDEELWIPIKVTSQDSQSQHDPKGKPLTVAMAMNGRYAAYYGDTYRKPLIELRRGDWSKELFTKVLVEAFNASPMAKATAKKAAKKATKKKAAST